MIVDMARPFLNPTERDKVGGTWVATAECPKKIINFGLVPNLKKLLPGDLLLFQSTDNAARPDKISREIVTEQKKQNFPEESCVWTHAAVYISDFKNIFWNFN